MGFELPHRTGRNHLPITKLNVYIYVEMTYINAAKRSDDE
jgi:hypothetical protein